jgi:hypothetical protein
MRSSDDDDDDDATSALHYQFEAIPIMQEVKQNRR